MKNKFLSIIIALLFFAIAPNALAKEESFYGIGAELVKDPFNNKIIIAKVLPDSPAEKAGIKAGSEIVSVDKVKVRKMKCVCEAASKIRGEEGTSVKLVIRRGWRWKTYEIKREIISIKIPEKDPVFESYWRQIAPKNYIYSKAISNEAAKGFSRKYRKNVIPAINYWLERKAQIKEGYNTCMSYSKDNQETCFINLLNRENETTNYDKRIYDYLNFRFDN